MDPFRRPALYIGLGGLGLAFMPGRLLEVLVTVGWEVDIVRLSGLLVLAVSLLWQWAMEQGGEVAQRMQRWVAAIVSFGVAYVLSGRPIFLLFAFSVLTGAALNIGMERAHRASEDLLKRLKPKNG